MGCGGGKDRQDGDDLEVDEIEERRVVEPTGDSVHALHPRNRYAAAVDEGDGDGDGDSGPGDGRGGGGPNKPQRKKKRRDDDDDDDEEDGGGVVQRDKDLERLLAAYKEKPRAGGTLLASKQAAIKRQEAQRAEEEQVVSLQVSPARRVNLKSVLADEEDLGDDGGDDGRASPSPPAAQQLEPWNDDVAALSQQTGFRLQPRTTTKPSPSPDTATRQAAAVREAAKARANSDSITPLPRQRDDDGADYLGTSPHLVDRASDVPGHIEDAAVDDDSDDMIDGLGRVRAASSFGGGMASSTRGFDSGQPTRNNSQRGFAAAHLRGRVEADEFSFD